LSTHFFFLQKKTCAKRKSCFFSQGFFISLVKLSFLKKGLWTAPAAQCHFSYHPKNQFRLGTVFFCNYSIINA